MAKAQGVSPATVQRIWSARELKPHRVKTFKLSGDKRFEEKLVDVVGLYLNPPENAIVLCMDEALGVVGEPGAEALECLGELEVGLGVVQLGVERIELRLDRGFAFAQLGCAGAELVDRDELLLVAVQQSSDRVLGAGEVALERVSSAGDGVRGAQRLKPAVDLGVDQRGVFEQRTRVQTSSSTSARRTGRFSQTRPSGRRWPSVPEQR